MIDPLFSAPQASKSTGLEGRDAALRSAAEKLEAAFLSEMLKHAGLGKAREGFGGGVGEEHFASFTADLHARALVERGGIGLAEHLFNALKERS